MKHLWAIMLLATLSADATEVHVNSKEMDQVIDQRVDTSWQAACLLRGTNCEKIPRPAIVFSDELPYQMQGSYTRGEGVIYVRMSYQMDPYSMVVMVHEMIHYLQYIRNGVIIPTTIQRCAQEQEAFEADDRFAKRMGLDEHPDAFTWAEAVSTYGCTPEQLKR